MKAISNVHSTRRGVSAWLAMLLLTAAMMILPGCYSAPGKDKKLGTYYQNIPGSRDRVTEAARQVMGEMGYLLDSDTVDAGVAKLRYRTAFDTKILLSIDPSAGDNYSRVGVLVTPGHSEGLSQNVLKRIDERAAGVR